MRLVVLGGSAASTPEMFEAIETWPGGPERRPTLEVVLVGRDRDRLELVASASRARLSGTGPSIAVLATDDLDRALDGAIVVVQQVRIGGLAARAFDESFPWAFGLPGEETMGPGGYANALRTVPALRPAWERVATLAPDSLVIDLTNPAGIVAAAARREHDLRVVSVCDSPVTFIEAIAGRLGRPPERVARRYVGLNHLGWYVPEDEAELAAIDDVSGGVDPAVGVLHGAQPTPYVRYHVHPDRLLVTQRGKPTRAEALLELRDRMLETYRDGAAGAAAADPPRRGAVWYAAAVMPLMDAWLHGSDAPLVLGVRNGGSLPEVPPGVTVEVAHRVPRPGVLERLDPPARPPLVAAMLAAQGRYEDLATTAALGGDRTARLRALVANPMVRDLDQAVGLLDAIERGERDGWGLVPWPGAGAGPDR